jgi:hypothetical protein
MSAATSPNEKTEDAKQGPKPGSPGEALAAIGSALAKGAKEAASTADPNVPTAFALGWQMAELYRPHSRRRSKPAAQDDLPGLGALEDAHRIKILVDQVQAGLARLHDAISKTGLPSPDLAKARPQIEGAEEQRKHAVWALHMDTLALLTATDFRLGKAYGLGRALADTCRKPTNAAEACAQLDRHRLSNLLSWLDDLSSALPQHAAHSVAASLERWRDCALQWHDRTLPMSDDELLRRLRRQGELWRALLSGEKHPVEMLEVDNWLDVARDFMRRASRIGRGLALRMPLLTFMIVALFGVGVWLMLHQHDEPAAIVAGATSVIGSLGLTWKGIGGALGQLLEKLEQPLFGAATDKAIADAITLLPGYSKHDKRKRGVVAMDMPMAHSGGLPSAAPAPAREASAGCAEAS